MKRNLIIHIGMGKTGSSSIQKTLRLARHTLDSYGVKYMGLMFEHAQTNSNYTWQRVDGWMEYINLNVVQASKELAHSLQYLDDNLDKSVHTLIWSSEALFDRPDNIIPSLNAVIDRFNITIVGYIRRPDSWISSAYLQWGIKDKSYSGPLKDFNEWASDKPYGAADKLHLWSQLAANNYFFNFNEIKDIGNHFVEEVLHLDSNIIKPARDNDTPPPGAMALFSYFNSLSYTPIGPDRVESILKKAGLYSKHQKAFDYNNLLPTDSDIRNYMLSNKEEVLKVNYFLACNNQKEFDIQELEVKDNTVTQAEINRMLFKLIVEQQNEIENLKCSIKNNDIEGKYV